MAKQIKIKKNSSFFRSYEEREGQFKYIGEKRREKLLEVGFVASEIGRAALQKKSPLFVRLSMEWENFVGAELAQTTHPAKLHQNSLTVKCQGPAAMALQYRIPQVLRRLNTLCGLSGEQALHQIKILQDVKPSQKISEAKSALPPRPSRKIGEDLEKNLLKEIDGIESEDLKNAFSKFLGHFQKK